MDFRRIADPETVGLRFVERFYMVDALAQRRPPRPEFRAWLKANQSSVSGRPPAMPGWQ